MADVIFSSWQDEVIDNRGVAADAKAPAKTKLLDEFSPGEPIKAFLGWDGIVIRDAGVDIVGMCAKYAQAVQSESCGKCFPCRVGTGIISDMLKKIAAGEGTQSYIDKIKELAPSIRDGSKCSIGQTGLIPILHALQYFPKAFAEAIAGKKKSPDANYRYSVTAPCLSVCPSGLDIPAYIEEISEQRFTQSLATIRKSICFPGTLGRVCVRPCESSCRRTNVDDSLSIKYLKRFVADYEIDTNRHQEIPTAAKTGKKVAIIGAGPAGVSCANYLIQMGHQATIFERHPEPGGMAAMGIPDYRLPRNILHREVELVQELGVEIRYNVQVGKDISFAKLREDYDAIFIGVGAQGSMPMGVEGEDQNYDGYIPGVKYLLDINLGRDPYPAGKKVVVVGGGNVAIDCVRSSFRIGKPDVNLVYRRSKAEMPADPVEIKDAEDEEVKFHYLCNPTKIIAKEGKVVGVELIRMELGEPDQSGRRRPVPVKGSEFVIDADIVIPAIGQQLDLSFLNEADGIKATKRNTVVVDPEIFETSQPGVFSAGDCVTGPDVLVRATGNGKRAAEKIDLYLKGDKVAPSSNENFRNLFATLGVYNEKEHIGIIGGLHKSHLPMLDPLERKWNFAEVEDGYTTDVAIKEAARCLRCYRIGMIALG
ncbi:MAG: FAD-dependent oxidoreductase [Syntrophales bacterium]|jgi:formate dehydrogenase beta subunit|nr:FAD-dependent oxidoreductase [Syntrophales bacterium]